MPTALLPGEFSTDCSSKMNLDMEFLKYLFDIGKEKADEFLKNHYDKIGIKSSLDVEENFF